MDVTSNTVDEDNLKSGYTAIKNDGTVVEGAYTVKLQNKFFSSDTDAQIIVPDDYIVYKRYEGSASWGGHTKGMGYSIWCGIINDNTLVEEQTYNLIGTIQILDETDNILEEQNFNIERELNDSSKRINYNSTYIDYITLPRFTNSGFSIGLYSNITTSYAIKIDLVCVQNNNNYEGLGVIAFPNTSYYDAYKLRFTSERFYTSKITSFNDFIDSFTYIPSGAFAFCEFNSDITFTNVTSIGYGGFMFFPDFPINVGHQHAFSFPVLTSMGYSCFGGNQNIASINCSILSKINDYAFLGCKNLTTAIFPSCTDIGRICFSGCSNLSILSFPNCLSINGYAFQNCSSLISINFPKCTTISYGTFQYCSKLTTVSFPQCTTIGNTAFASCKALVSVNFPQCTSVGNSAFMSCSSLTNINFPNCTFVSTNAFAYCYNLMTVNLSNCQYIGASAFHRCSMLVSINLPNCEMLGSYAFSNCYELTTVDLPKVSTIYANTFQSCYNLISLYLLGNTVCTLATINAFNSTPISNYSTSAGQWGSVFVPSSLYADYCTSSNWSLISSRIVSV